MNLVIDQGNTRVKFSIFEKQQEVNHYASSKLEWNKFAEFVAPYQLDACIISNVKGNSFQFIEKLSQSVPNILELEHNLPLPFLNSYKTPETLGRDRIAAVAGAQSLFPHENILVIDAGTAITYDIITASSEYIGGNISPGLNTRFKALNEFTGKLPLVENYSFTDSIGNTTIGAIQIGVIQGVLFELEGFIKSFASRYENLRIVMTGGDSQFFDNKLKKTIFVVSNLVSIGLNSILQYNVENS